MKRIPLWIILACALLTAACAKTKPASGPVHKYRIDGEILKTNPADQTATIKHKDIQGWMQAMTMDYPIRTKEDFTKLHAGDHIIGTVYVQDEDFSVGDIHVDGLGGPGPVTDGK
jgi:Cu/Ag efflux protein CusF